MKRRLAALASDETADCARTLLHRIRGDEVRVGAPERPVEGHLDRSRERIGDAGPGVPDLDDLAAYLDAAVVVERETDRDGPRRIAGVQDAARDGHRGEIDVPARVE